jgi:membrane protein involved in colicin uptake
MKKQQSILFIVLCVERLNAWCDRHFTVIVLLAMAVLGVIIWSIDLDLMHMPFWLATGGMGGIYLLNAVRVISQQQKHRHRQQQQQDCSNQNRRVV